MLSPEEKTQLTKTLLDTEDPHSPISLFITADSDSAPPRFAEKTKTSADDNVTFKKRLSGIFDLGQKKHNIDDGQWILLIKRQITFEIYLGLITTPKQGVDRLKQLFDVFANLIRKNSDDIKNMAEEKDISTKVDEMIHVSLPNLDFLQKSLENYCSTPQSKIILEEFKAPHVLTNIAYFIENFIKLRDKSTPYTREEKERFQYHLDLILLFNEATKIINEYKPNNENETIRVGLIVVAINDICLKINRNDNYKNGITDFVSYLRGIKNDRVDDNLEKVKKTVMKLFDSAKTVKLKNVIRDRVLKPFYPNYKSVKETSFDQESINSISKKMKLDAVELRR